MPFHTHQLGNGLTILAETNPSALSAAVAFWVRTGARDETPEVSGVSHFLEHMIFKGTERRNSIEVNRDFSRIGADNNAWTSEENTVFHAVVLPEFLPEVVEILTDIMRPSLRTEDFNTEKTVILDEIVRYQVQPGWLTYDNARKAFYGNHPLGNSVLGTTESITALECDQMRRYFAERYVASNIHVIGSGNIDFPRFVELIEKACSHWPQGETTRLNRVETAGMGGLRAIARPPEKVTQQYVMMIAPGPSASSEMRFASGVLATALGDSSGSRLYWALTDPGLAEEAGLGADECDGAGAYYLSYTAPPENAEQCFEIVQKLLAEVQSKNITQDELDKVKTKIASREVRASERTSRRMINIGKDWAYLGKYRNVDDELKSLDSVTLQSIREVLDRYPLTQFTTTTVGPLKHFVGAVASET